MSKLMFLQPQIEDYDRIKNMLSDSGELSCTLSFGTLMTWRDYCQYEIATYNGSLFIKMTDRGIQSFSLPIGGNFEEAMQALIEHTQEKNIDLRLWTFEGKAFEKFCALYKDDFVFEESRDLFEYIYSREKLAELSNKKYHAKRNHISAFAKMHNWEYHPLCEDSIADAKALLLQWYKENPDKASDIEKNGAFMLLDNLDKFNIKGALITVDGITAAFTMGCPINNDVFDVIIEKALSQYVGAYSFINNIFVRNELSSYKYVNREDDMGLEGLRKAKLSYHPEILLKKYICIHKSAARKDAEELFAKTFKDENDESAKRFMDNFYDTGLFIYKGGRLASMMYLLPALCDNEQLLYIYGAATREDCRKRGYMTRLLDTAKEVAAQKECSALFLRPFDKTAEKIYKNNGFEYSRFFTRYEAIREDIDESKYSIRTLPSANEYEKIRNSYLCKGDIKWDAKVIQLALDNGSDSPCSAFAGSVDYMDFCAVCEKRKDTLFIRELFCDIPKKVCNALMNYTGCSRCIALIRADKEGIGHTMEYRIDGTVPQPKGYTGLAFD